MAVVERGDNASGRGEMEMNKHLEEAEENDSTSSVEPPTTKSPPVPPAASSRLPRRSVSSSTPGGVSPPPTVSTRRRCSRFRCAVSSCTNDELSVKSPDGRAIQFFDFPDNNDRRNRRLWLQAVPELEFVVSPLHRKVCEKHFLDGRPTEQEPVPSLHLRVDEPVKVKKRKSESPTEPLPDKAKKPKNGPGGGVPLDEGVPTPPSLDSVLRQLAESATTAVVATAENPSTRDKPQSGPTTRIVKLPFKTLKSLSANGTLPRGIQIMTQKPGGGGMTKTLQLPKGIVARPVVSVRSVTDSLATTGRVDAKPTKSLDRVISHLKTTRGDAHSPAVKDDLDNPPTTPGPTLLSVLEGLKTEAPSGDDPAPVDSPCTSAPHVVAPPAGQSGITCYRCVNELPVLRRSLGRLESRLDSMISMVKTLCSRQTSLKNVATVRPLAMSGIRATSDNALKKVIRVAPSTAGNATRLVPAMNAKAMNMSYLAKTISRTLLLFPTEAFTMAEFRAKGPAAVRSLNRNMLNGILEKLVADGLLRRLDPHLQLADDDSAFEKERVPGKLTALAAYDIPLETYLASFNKPAA